MGCGSSVNQVAVATVEPVAASSPRPASRAPSAKSKVPSVASISSSSSESESESEPEPEQVPEPEEVPEAEPEPTTYKIEVKPVEMLPDFALYEQLLSKLADLINVCHPSQRVKHQNEYASLQADLASLQVNWREQSVSIAVLGAGKSGKTGVLNAWCGEDLVPSQELGASHTTIELRCLTTTTTTTTTGQREQQGELKYVAEYYTAEEFAQLYFPINFNAEERAEMSVYLGKAERHFYTEDLAKLKEELRAILGEPAQARALKKLSVCLLVNQPNTHHNTPNQNVVLVETPAHSANANANYGKVFKEANVVVYAKRLSPIDSFAHEKEFLSALSGADRGKLFVALTFSEQGLQEEQEQQQQHSTGRNAKFVEVQRRFWRENGVDAARVIPVYAHAEYKNAQDSGNAT